MKSKILIEHDQLAYSVTRTAKLLGMSRQTIYVEINAGRLKSFIHGKRRRSITATAINDWLYEREQATNPQTRLSMPHGMKLRGGAMR